ncbi:Uncharacterised protein [Staphylococcus agnetis]|nr:Uncharacterised protein [Staphylococcus agnetis]
MNKLTVKDLITVGVFYSDIFSLILCYFNDWLHTIFNTVSRILLSDSMWDSVYFIYYEDK